MKQQEKTQRVKLPFDISFFFAQIIQETCTKQQNKID